MERIGNPMLDDLAPFGAPVKTKDFRTVKIELQTSCLDLQSLNYGEFDPGSERTLAAWIRHASRARKVPSGAE